MERIIVESRSYLPKGITIQDVAKAAEEGLAPFTKDSFACRVNAEELDTYKETLNHVVMDSFNSYLTLTGRSNRTANSYVDKINKVCKDVGIDFITLYLESKYTIDDLIRMYSSFGIMALENRARGYAPATALKAFEDFLIYDKD